MSLRVLPLKDVAISVTFPVSLRELLPSVILRELLPSVILRDLLPFVILRERSDRRISAGGTVGFFAASSLHSEFQLRMT